MVIRTIVIIIILFSSLTFFISDINLIKPQHTTNKELIGSNTSNTVKNDVSDEILNQEIKSYFYKVAAVPYKVDFGETKSPEEFWKLGYGDCDDKSYAFADYLNKKGVQNIEICKVFNENTGYGHCFVLIDGYVYDPTSEPPLYKANQEKYLKYLEKQGFTMVIKTNDLNSRRD